MSEMNQIIRLSTQLTTGVMGRSMQSPRTEVLMKFEHERRHYNRVNGENVDLYTFLCLDRRGTFHKVDIVCKVLMGVTFYKRNYNQKKRGGIMSRNVRIKNNWVNVC